MGAAQLGRRRVRRRAGAALVLGGFEYRMPAGVDPDGWSAPGRPARVLTPDRGAYGAPVMGTEVYFLVDMPPGLAVEEALLGTRWEVPRAPAPTTVFLPRRTLDPLDESADSTAILAPDLGGAEGSVEAWWRSLYSEEELGGRSLWGWVQHWVQPEDRVEVAPLNRAVAVATYDGDDLDGARANFASFTTEALADWVAAVAEWLDVLAGRLITTTRRSGVVGPTGGQRFPLRVDPTAARAERFAPQPSFLIVGYEPAATTLAHWTIATKHVGGGRTPPLAHRQLREARAARLHDDFRRAVIDAATACEVGLSEAIRAHLAAMPRAALDELVNRRLNGLGALYQFHVRGLATITAVTRKQLDDDLASVRNRVAHAGYRPTADEAAAAIDVAAALVGEVAPLPAP